MWDRQGVEADDAARGRSTTATTSPPCHTLTASSGAVGSVVEDEGQHGVEGVGRVQEFITVQSGKHGGLLSAGVSVFDQPAFGDGKDDVQGEGDDGGNHSQFLQRDRRRDDSPGGWDVITRGLRWATPAEELPCDGSRPAAPTCTSGRGNRSR